MANKSYDKRIRRQYIYTKKNGLSDVIVSGTLADTWSNPLAVIEPDQMGLPFVLDRFTAYTANTGGVGAGVPAATVVTLHLTIENSDGQEEEVASLSGNPVITTSASVDYALSIKNFYFTRPIRVYVSADAVTTADIQIPFDFIVSKVSN